MTRAFNHGSGCVSTYLQEINRFTPPRKEEEQARARPMSHAEAEGPAHHDLVHANLGFVVKIAGEYRNKGLPLEDLFNELSAALTTEDLAAMNLKVDLERQKPEDVAQQFLEDKGLL